jgi:hypothetical protein
MKTVKEMFQNDVNTVTDQLLDQLVLNAERYANARLQELGQKLKHTFTADDENTVEYNLYWTLVTEYITKVTIEVTNRLGTVIK